MRRSLSRRFFLLSGLRPFGQDRADDMTAAGGRTFAAAGTFLLVDHVYTFCVLCDSSFRTCFCTFTALWAGHWTNRFLFYNLQTCKLRVEGFVECLRTGINTGKTCHTGTSFFYFKFFHLNSLRVFFSFIVTLLIILLNKFRFFYI